MGYTFALWPFLAIFKMLSFSKVSCFFKRFSSIELLNVFVELFFAYLRQFYFLTQTEYFAWAIPFALWPFLAIFKMLSCFECQLFFQAGIFAYNNFNVFLEKILACFRQFHFLTQTEYLAWAIAFALWPFLAIFKMLLFFENQVFFRAVFCIEQL